MEENPDCHMETDVSSTTQDIPAPEEVSGSVSTMEVTVEVAETTVEVEELTEDEQDQRIDSNTPETVPYSPQKKKESTKEGLPESDSFESTLVKETQVLALKIPTKETAQESSSETPNRNAPPIQLSNTLSSEKDMTPIKPSTTLSPKKDSTQSKLLYSKNSSNDGKSLNEDITPRSSSKMISQELSYEAPNDTSIINETEDQKSIQQVEESHTQLFSENQNEVTEQTHEDESKEATSSWSSKIENIEITEKEEVVVLIPSEIPIEVVSTDSQEPVTLASELSDKDHNKSISRELKSLIDSAKESKIISECTQLKSKTRKSRLPHDTSCVSLNSSVDADKIQGHRRESSASQKSNCSEKSEKMPLKRSMRSQNPEFVHKQKQFLNTVTAKFQKGDHDSSRDANYEEPSDDSKKKEISNEIPGSSPKKKKLEEEKPPAQLPAHKSKNLRSDPYCWQCHWAIEVTSSEKNQLAQCTICPRSFHSKCLSGPERVKLSTEKNWVCPKCITILHAESSETRPPVMRKVSLGMLCDLLKYALKRMMELNGVEPFMGPVDRAAFPDYDKYVVHPVDLNLMKENITAGLYGSTEAFLSDAQWILHNSIIFNTHGSNLTGAYVPVQSKLTAAARGLVRSCRAEMGEIEACPECYAAAHARRPTWFTDVCSTPHILLWAKLKGFPYWPAKGMSVNNSGLVDVRFFGAHDRAWVPAKDCFLYSEKDPNNFRTKRQDILDSMQEAEQHIRNLSRKFQKFVYPAYKVVFEPTKLNEQLKAMIPTFDPVITKNKEKAASSPATKRSISKSSKDSFADGEKSDEEETSEQKRKMADGAEILREDDKQTAESDNTKEVEVTEKTKPDKGKDKEKEKESRKRRRSQMEEAAVFTIMSPPSGKRTRMASAEMTIINKNDESQNKPDNTKNPDTNKIVEKPVVESPKVQLKEQKEDTSVVTRVTRTSTPSSTSKQASKQTPKVNTPKETDKVKKSKAAQRDSTPNEKEMPQENKSKKKDKTPKGDKFATSTPKSTDKKNDTPISKKEKSKEQDKQAKPQDKQAKPVLDKDSTPISKSKSLKDSIAFDDEDTSLALLAKQTSGPCFPTISDVRSLKQTNLTQSSANKSIEIEVNTSIFTPTGTDQVNNMKDAIAKLQRLRNDTEQSMVGRVGVRAFARMTSPPAAPAKETSSSDKVEIEVKAEPMDYEENQTEKINLLNTIRLRPVNPQLVPSLREVRINKVIPNTSTTTVVIRKPQVTVNEVRPKARKTFPQPQKSGDGRSELNSKNSMVYIPIQPPITQAPPVRPPVKVTSSAVNGPTVATPPLRPLSSVSTSSSYNIVNTVTTPLMTVVSMPSGLPNSSPALTAITQMSNMGQMGPLANMGHLSNIGQIGNLGQLGQIGPVGQVSGVHTVPLITSVNGQWTFSLQPMMSVGGVDRVPTPPLVNGVSDALVPLPSTSATIATPPSLTNITVPPTSRTADSGELPRLQLNPLACANQPDSNTTNEVPVPSAAGPITAMFNQNAAKLVDVFRKLLEESIEKMEPAAAQQQLTLLKLEMEKLQWRHKQEIIEIKHNSQLVMAEMRTSFEKEKTRLLADTRRACHTELLKSVKHAKSRQWCANCLQEAQFYCCWNTSYCDYPCQRAHWAQHFEFCTQKRSKDNDTDSVDLTEERLQPPENPPALQRNCGPSYTVGGKRVLSRNHSQTNANTSGEKSSIIVSMVEDTGGNSTVKCVGTYKAKSNKASPSLLLNNQIMNNEETAAKKVVTSGGYLIVGAGASGNSSVVIN